MVSVGSCIVWPQYSELYRVSSSCNALSFSWCSGKASPGQSSIGSSASLDVPLGNFTGEVLEKVAQTLGKSSLSDVSPSQGSGSAPSVKRSSSDRFKKQQFIPETSPGNPDTKHHHSGIFRKKDKDKDKNKLQKKLYRKSHHDEYRKSMSPVEEMKPRRSFGGILKRSESGRPVSASTSLVPSTAFEVEKRKEQETDSNNEDKTTKTWCWL